MPAKSKAQQMAAGAALSAKCGEKKVSELKGASRSMYESMTEQQLEEMALVGERVNPNTNRSLDPTSARRDCAYVFEPSGSPNPTSRC
jgi:hypothetical protein